MTNIELRKQLGKYPDNMQVFLAERMTEYTYGLLNTVSETDIDFMEEPDGEPLAKETVIVLTEY